MSCDCKNYDSVIDSDKIESMEMELLDEVKVDAYRWKTLFRCKHCKSLWEKRYQEDRFVGNPQLIKVDNDYVIKEWGQNLINNLYIQIKGILDVRKSLHIEDDFGITKCWDELTELLSKDEADTMMCLELCTKDEIYWICEVFDDISFKFQSKKFVDFLIKLQLKYMDINMMTDILFAEKAIDVDK